MNYESKGGRFVLLHAKPAHGTGGMSISMGVDQTNGLIALAYDCGQERFAAHLTPEQALSVAASLIEGAHKLKPPLFDDSQEEELWALMHHGKVVRLLGPGRKPGPDYIVPDEGPKVMLYPGSEWKRAKRLTRVTLEEVPDAEAATQADEQPHHHRG